MLTGVVFVAALSVGGRGVITDAPGAVSIGAFAGVFLYIRRLPRYGHREGIGDVDENVRSLR